MHDAVVHSLPENGGMHDAVVHSLPENGGMHDAVDHFFAGKWWNA
jgi:hypothetical protein